MTPAPDSPGDSTRRPPSGQDDDPWTRARLLAILLGTLGGTAFVLLFEVGRYLLR